MKKVTLAVMCAIKEIKIKPLLYGRVSQGLGTTEFTNLIG